MPGNPQELLAYMLQHNGITKTFQHGTDRWRLDWTKLGISPTQTADAQLGVLAQADAITGGRLLKDLARAGAQTPALIMDMALPPGFMTEPELGARWVAVDLDGPGGMTLFLPRAGQFREFHVLTEYGGRHSPRVNAPRVIRPGDTPPLRIVTIMNYPDDTLYNLMCMIWMRQVQQHAPGSRILVLTADGLPPAVAAWFKTFANVEVVAAGQHPIEGFDHFNLAFKLYHLARLREAFLFLDADMFVLADLDYLWQRRNYKPWMAAGTGQPLTYLNGHPVVGLNSGLQLVSDPPFYNYDQIRACFMAHGRRFPYAGEDQCLIRDYFETIEYLPWHPDIGPEWNVCSLYARLAPDTAGVWHGQRQDHPDKPVFISHYWNGVSRPWNMECPLYLARQAEFDRQGISYRAAAAAHPAVKPGPATSHVMRVALFNAPPDLPTRPGNHPFYPLDQWRVEVVPDLAQADWGLVHLDPTHPIDDYKRFLYLHHELFKQNETRFVFCSDHGFPDFLYTNRALHLAAHPIYERRRNEMSRVVPIPFQYDVMAPELVLDRALHSHLRNLPKVRDFFYPGPAADLAKAGALPADVAQVTVRPLSRDAWRALPQAEQLRQGRELLTEIAQSRYLIHVRQGLSDIPYLVYNALMVGTIPILIATPDLAFSERLRWQDWSFVVNGLNIKEIQNISIDQASLMRDRAMNFWDTYCFPPLCNDRILSYYLTR